MGRRGRRRVRVGGLEYAAEKARHRLVKSVAPRLGWLVPVGILIEGARVWSVSKTMMRATYSGAANIQTALCSTYKKIPTSASSCTVSKQIVLTSELHDSPTTQTHLLGVTRRFVTTPSAPCVKVQETCASGSVVYVFQLRGARLVESLAPRLGRLALVGILGST
jgi:hypothetical protein